MFDPTEHLVSSETLPLAGAAPVVAFDDAALLHRRIPFEELPAGLKAELVQAAEHGHREAFRMGTIGTFISEALDGYPETRIHSEIREAS